MGQINSVGQPGSSSSLSGARINTNSSRHLTTGVGQAQTVSEQLDASVSAGDTRLSRKRQRRSLIPRNIFTRGSQNSSLETEGSDDTTRAIENRQKRPRSRRWSGIPFKRRSTSRIRKGKERAVDQGSETLVDSVGISPEAESQTLLKDGVGHFPAADASSRVADPVVSRLTEQGTTPMHGAEANRAPHSEREEHREDSNVQSFTSETTSIAPISSRAPSLVQPSQPPSAGITRQENVPVNQFVPSGTLVVVQGVVQVPEASGDSRGPLPMGNSAGDERSSRPDVQHGTDIFLPSSSSPGESILPSMTPRSTGATGHTEDTTSSGTSAEEAQHSETSSPMSSGVDMIGNLLR